MFKVTSYFLMLLPFLHIKNGVELMLSQDSENKWLQDVNRTEGKNGQGKINYARIVSSNSLLHGQMYYFITMF